MCRILRSVPGCFVSQKINRCKNTILWFIIEPDVKRHIRNADLYADSDPDKRIEKKALNSPCSPITNIMIRFVLILLALFQMTQVNAQSFSITPNPTYGSVDLDENPSIFFFYAEAFITNNTSEVLTLKWERIVNEIPECWVTGVSDITLSTPPMVSYHQFTVAPNSTDNRLAVDTYFTGESSFGATSGEGHVILKVSNEDIPTDTVLVDYFLSATGGETCSTLGISDKDKEAIEIYPNPSSDFIHLSENTFIESLVIYNLLGEVVLRFNASTNRKYDIAELPKGIYLVTLKGTNDHSLKTLKLLKK